MCQQNTQHQKLSDEIMPHDRTQSATFGIVIFLNIFTIHIFEYFTTLLSDDLIASAPTLQLKLHDCTSIIVVMTNDDSSLQNSSRLMIGNVS